MAMYIFTVCVNVFKLNRFVTVDKNLSNPINCKWSSIKPGFPNAVSSDAASVADVVVFFVCTSTMIFNPLVSFLPQPQRHRLFVPQLLTFPCNLFAVTGTISSK